MNYSQNLSRFFTVQLSMFVVVISNSLYILSYLQVVVNNFFIFLCCLSNATTLISYHVCHCLSTTFFILFRKYRAEKEGFEPSRRLSQPTPLAGEPLRPLGYFRMRYEKTGGESGIRTHGCFHIAGFQDRCFQPLSHLSVRAKA